MAAPSRPERILDAALSGVAALVSVVSGLLFLVMTALVVAQIVFRYVLNAPLVGSEEAARIVMIYVVLLGSALCLRHGTHMAVLYFHALLPRRLALAVNLLVQAGIAAIALILVVKGAEFAGRAMFMTTPALQIPRGYVIWAFPLGGALMLLFIAETVLRELTGRPLPGDAR